MSRSRRTERQQLTRNIERAMKEEKQIREYAEMDLSQYSEEDYWTEYKEKQRNTNWLHDY